MNCQRCGGPTIPLFTSFACKAECDLKPAAPRPAPAGPWRMFHYVENGLKYSLTPEQARLYQQDWLRHRPTGWGTFFWNGVINRNKAMIDDAIKMSRARIHDIMWED